MIKQLVRTIIDTLHDEPIALSLVIINVLFILAGLYGIREIVKATERKDALLAQLVDHCKLNNP